MRVKIIKNHLLNDIIPFWKELKDEVYGGYYGEVDFNLHLHKEADKGGILNSRILWFFSNAYLTLGDKEYLEYATHAYEYLKKAFLDLEQGGIYWSVTFDGKPKDTSKHTYNQAFAIYALSSYYDATKEAEALHIAYGLVDIIEKTCKDDIGYLEAFNREFEPESNEKLSENGLMASRTMNTLLHVFEAYTELYRVDNNEKIADNMRWMLEVFANKVYNPVKRRLEVFFDFEMNSLADMISYGHDIEASWLVDRGCEILGDAVYSNKISPITMDLTDHIYTVAYNGEALNNECFEGEIDEKKIWWVQAEAILGFLNGYEKDRSRTEYLKAAATIWDYIQNHMIDRRSGSEWFYELSVQGIPNDQKEMVGPWKCPYHNGRMCLEVIRRNIGF